MELSEGIRKIGFRRWYERQLLESHFYLVSCILCLLMVLACLEGFSLRAPGWEPVLRLAAMFAGGAVCIWSLARYRVTLEIAMHAAERSTCVTCGAYGLLDVKPAGLLAPREREGKEPGLRPPALAVRCRKCGHEWVIE